MELIGIQVLATARKRHADARKALLAWETTARTSGWLSLDNIKLTMPKTDGVVLPNGKVATVFNIKGNSYRLIVQISYVARVVDVRMFLAHAEYDKEKWKRQF